MESMGIEKLLIQNFQNKKVLITGHTGFKGSWLIVILNYLGAKIRGYALQPEPKSLYRIINGDDLCKSVISDIRDLERLKEEITAYKPDYIFHLAAQALVIKGYEDPYYNFNVNMTGTLNVLESLRHLDHPCNCIVVTTDKVYKNHESDIAFKEIDPLGGNDPYSASKAAAEIITNSYRKSYFTPEKYSSHQKCISTARSGNVIGGGDWSKDRIMPDIIRSIQNDIPLELRNPKAVRPWQHVSEPISGYLVLASAMNNDPQNSEIASAWNFGPNYKQLVNVEDIVNKSFSIFGKGKYWFANQDIQHEVLSLILDSSKAKNILNWESKLSCEQALEYTIREYQQFEKKVENPRSVMIHDFKKIAGWN
jgi:CDP-glucose 4,6-dehydratase